ncbi:MAG: hypothetical protein H9893_09565 [Candidatus Niameybacter stercoravium]|nr:hypothetical protein [Candidatus Niameybacter stercoravium]
MKTPEEIQKRYSEIMKQSSMQILLVPLLAIAIIVGAVMNSQIIALIGMLPIAAYMLWFRLVVYRCPKCGHLFDQYQIYTYECKHCHTKFGRR